MTVVSKNVYIDKLDKIVDKFIQPYYIAIKMKPDNIQSVTYIECVVEHNDKDSKVKISDHVRISKYKIIFGKGYTRNWPEV